MPQPVTPPSMPERPAHEVTTRPASVVVPETRVGRAMAVGAGVVGLVAAGAHPLSTLSFTALAAAFLVLPLGAVGVTRVAWRVFSARRDLTVTADDHGVSVSHAGTAWGAEVVRVTPWAELPVPALVATEEAGVAGLRLRLADGRERFVSAAQPGFAAFAAAVRDRWPGDEAALRAHSLRVTGAWMRGAAWKRFFWNMPLPLVIGGVITLNHVVGRSSRAMSLAGTALMLVWLAVLDLRRRLRGEHDQPAFPDRADP